MSLSWKLWINFQSNRCGSECEFDSLRRRNMGKNLLEGSYRCRCQVHRWRKSVQTCPPGIEQVARTLPCLLDPLLPPLLCRIQHLGQHEDLDLSFQPLKAGTEVLFAYNALYKQFGECRAAGPPLPPQHTHTRRITPVCMPATHRL